MGSIQNSINAGLGTIGAGVALASREIEQQKQNNIATAQDKQIIETTTKALEADQFEAQQAILAHAKDEGLSEDEITKLKEDPSYAQHLRETVLKEQRKQALSLASKKYDETPEGKYEYDKNTGSFFDPKEKAGKELNYAYERLRELEQRTDTTRQLKFNLESAKARIKARGGKE
jgi:hypothetical protein